MRQNLWHKLSRISNEMAQMNCIHPEAKIGNNVKIGNFTTIHANVEIRDNCEIDCNVNIYPGVRIGESVKIFPGTTLAALPQD